MRFTNSAFLKELKKYLHTKYLPFWDKPSSTVNNDIWIPKSTIAYQDVSLHNLSKALMCLDEVNVNYKMKIHELSIIEFTESEREILRIDI